MKKLLLGIMLIVLFAGFTGCTSLRNQQVNHPNLCNQVTIRITKVRQEYKVETRLLEIKSSEPIVLNQPITAREQLPSDFFGTMTSSWQFDLIAVPQVTIQPNKWAEMRVGSTNSVGTFESRSRMGDEEIVLSHGPGVVMKVKVTPVDKTHVEAKGIVSVGSEDHRTAEGWIRAYPFNIKCPLGKDTVLFQSSYTITSVEYSGDKTEWVITEENK